MPDRDEFLSRMERQLADLHGRIVDLTRATRGVHAERETNFVTNTSVMKKQHETSMKRLRELDAHALAHGLEEAEDRLDALRKRIEAALENHTRR